MQGSKHPALHQKLQDIKSRLRNLKEKSRPEMQSSIAPLEEVAEELALLLGESTQADILKTASNPLTLTQKVLNESPVVVARWKATMTLPVEYISDNVRQFGYTPEELISGETGFVQLIHPDDVLSQRSGLLEKVMSGAEWISHEYRLITRDGEIRWIDDHVHVERNSQGVPTWFQGVLIDITERKLLQQKLLRLEGQYHTLFNIIADPVFILDRTSGEILDVNDAMLGSYGYSRGELQGMNIRDIHAPEDRGNIRLDVRRQDYSLPVEYLHQSKDGCLFNVEVVSAEGQWQGIEVFVSCARNITERKTAEKERERLLEELEKSRSFFRTILNAIPLPVFVKDAQGRFIVFNRACREQLLGDESHWLGKTVQEVVPDKEMAQAYQQYDARLLKEPGIVSFESRTLYQDGSMRDILLCLSTYTHGDGKIGGLIGTITDISQQKQVEMRLRENEALLDKAQRIANMGVWTWTVADNTVTWTDALFDMFKVEKRADLSFETYAAVIHRDDLEQSVNTIRDTMASGDNSYTFEHRVLLPDGQVREVFIYGQIFRDSQGQPQRLVGVAQDITERKAVQRKEKALLAEVESVNAELKDFAYIVSHDLKAPLRSISSLSEWLIGDYQDKLDADGREMLQQLGAQSRRMYQLIDGILHYSSLGQINESRIDVDLNETVANVVSLLAPPEEVKIEVQQNLPVLPLEPTRIAQVFQNLLSNAIKYLDKPQGYVTVGAKAATGEWLFWVSDNGPGIEEKYFQKIFRIFQTLGGEKSFESTGVGLTVVKKIVEMYGGRVWVESVPGAGSCFYFTLQNEAAQKTGVSGQLEAMACD